MSELPTDAIESCLDLAACHLVHEGDLLAKEVSDARAELQALVDDRDKWEAIATQLALYTQRQFFSDAQKEEALTAYNEAKQGDKQCQ